MKFITVLFFLLITLKGISQSLNDSVLYWDENIRLKWCYFQGEVPSSERETKDKAKTIYSIMYSYSFEYGYIKYDVSVLFEKKGSWTKDTCSLKLLKHEQGHFDIAEIFGRKLRKYFKSYDDGDIESIREEEINRILENEDAFQDKYDLETKHGVIIKEQVKWNKLIKKKLEELKEYKGEYP